MQPAPENTLRQVKALLREGERDEARSLLIAHLKRDQDSAEAWWLLSYAIDDREQQIECVKRVLSLSPNNRSARARLEKLSKPKVISQAGRPKRQKAPSQPVEKKPPKKENNKLIAIISGISFLALAGMIYFLVVIINGTNAKYIPQNLTPSSTPIPPKSLPPTWTLTPTATRPPTKTPNPSASPTQTPPPIPTFTPIPRIVGPSKGKYAPDFTLANLNGDYISLSGYEGKPVLIVFWAVWCPYCEQEIPALNAVYKKYKNQGLVVLAINAKDRTGKVNNYQASHNISYPILLDSNGTIYNRYRVSGIPAHFMVNVNGKIIYAGSGGFSQSALDNNVRIWMADNTK